MLLPFLSLPQLLLAALTEGLPPMNPHPFSVFLELLGGQGYAAL